MGRDLVSPVFVGRDAELAALTSALDAAVAGEPAVVLLAGEAGVGKTRLAEEAAHRAREAVALIGLDGTLVLAGVAVVAYGVVALPRAARARAAI